MTLLGPAGTTKADMIDTDRIRRTYTRVLGEPRIGGPPLPTDETERDILAGLLRGHAGLLAPVIERQAPRMHGEQRKAAEHVVARTYGALVVDPVASTTDAHLYDLAFLARALLVLLEQPALGERPRPDPER